MQKTKVIRPTAFAKKYIPKPHPMQDRVDAFRVIPSLWTGARK